MALIKVRRDTSTGWTNSTKKLEDGEIGLDKSNKFFKIGIGSKLWGSQQWPLGKTLDQWKNLFNPVQWASISGKPSTYPPDAHSHNVNPSLKPGLMYYADDPNIGGSANVWGGYSLDAYNGVASGIVRLDIMSMVDSGSVDIILPNQGSFRELVLDLKGGAGGSKPASLNSFSVFLTNKLDRSRRVHLSGDGTPIKSKNTYDSFASTQFIEMPPFSSAHVTYYFYNVGPGNETVEDSGKRTFFYRLSRRVEREMPSYNWSSVIGTANIEGDSYVNQRFWLLGNTELILPSSGVTISPDTTSTLSIIIDRTTQLYTPTFSHTTLKWDLDEAPSFTLRHIKAQFITYDGGTSWLGSIVGEHS